MATYNGAAYLTDQIESIFGQTRLPDEIIVCDDGSTDGTVELLRALAARSPCPMSVIINNERLGSSSNFEKAIQLCSADLIALCDQDDLWRPHKVSVMEAAFVDDPDLGLLLTNADLIDHEGNPIKGDLWSKFMFGPRLQRWLDCPQQSYNLLLSRYFVTGATTAFRSRYRDLCLPVPDDTPTFIHDRWIAVLIGAVARVRRIEDRLIAYRLHPRQQLGIGKGSPLQHHLTPSRCSSDLHALDLMRQRITSSEFASVSEDFVRALDARRRHLAVRRALPSNPLRRLRGVTNEYLSGGYRRYPRGSADALKDLLVGAQ